MPLFNSSLCLAAQTPVNACTSVVLPWSTWPIVPIFASGCRGKDGFFSLLILLIFLQMFANYSRIKFCKLINVKTSSDFGRILSLCSVLPFSRRLPFSFSSSFLSLFGLFRFLYNLQVYLHDLSCYYVSTNSLSLSHSLVPRIETDSTT